MAAFDARLIERAARYLIHVLVSQTADLTVDYSRFYDGTDETHLNLKQALGLESDWYSAEHLMDVAIGELEQMGVVETATLDRQLADCEPDYRITLTDERPDILADDLLRFWDSE